jgi:hypothetical protein
MKNQPATDTNSIGCGVLGCAGGLILGLIGGGLLLVVLSLLLATGSSIPPASAAADAAPDLRLTVTESFLSRAIQDDTEDSVTVDVLPDNQFKVVFDTEVALFGAPLPVQVTGLFGLQLVGPSVEVRLLDTQVLGVNLPPELTNFFDDNLPSINQEVNQALQEVSTALGAQLILTDLSTDENRLRFEAREAP